MSPMLRGEELVRRQREARVRGLLVFPEWAALSQLQRRGLLFALRADGATLEEIGATVGLSRERIRQILRITDRIMQNTADRRFPLPVAAPNWKEYKERY